MDDSYLNSSVWRIEVYDIRGKIPFSGYITDLSNFYTSDLKIRRQRNYPDEVTFTLDLSQLQRRAEELGLRDPHDLLEPYMHKVKIYRNNKYICQAIVIKTSVNLNNNPNSTIDVSCVDILGILEKRLIHQDYGDGSWADFAAQVVMDAQHEPNRIYNYAFEGDGTSTDNVWFRGWKFTLGDSLSEEFPEWEPNTLYSMYDKCTHAAKFWEAKEHAFYSGETFSESNWTLLGILDVETGEVAPTYGVWREDNENPGPTGTAIGGWGGTSSCHMTASSFEINNGGAITQLNMAGSKISTTLVAPFYQAKSPLPEGYTQLNYIEANGSQKSILSVQANRKTIIELDIEIDKSSEEEKQTIFTSTVVDKFGTNPYGVYFEKSTNSLVLQYGGSEEKYALNDKTNFHLKRVDSRLYLNGELVARINNPDDSGAVYNYTTSNLILCSDENGDNTFSGKIYNIDISEGTRAISRLLPTEFNNETGLYDTMSGSFITSDIEDYISGGEKDLSRFSGKTVYSRIMAKNAQSGISSKIKLFVEGYGSTPKIESPEFTINGEDWQKIEYTWDPFDFDVYRFGIQIISGDCLVDSPVIYYSPVEGDDWDLGIRVGNVPTINEQLEAGWLRDRHSSTFQWKNAKSTLYDLSNMDSDDFWYEIDENYKFNIYINAGSDKVNLSLSYPKNITTMTVTTNADHIINYIRGDGSADVKQDPMVSGINITDPAPFTWIDYDEKAMKKYWALASSSKYDSERNIEALKNDIASEIATFSDIQDVPEITINNNTVDIENIHLGDMISVEVYDVPYVKRANGVYKITAYEINTDLNGMESLKITLLKPNQAQINALSFPALIKNMINRLNGARN